VTAERASTIIRLSIQFEKELSRPEDPGGCRTIILGLELLIDLTHKIGHPLDIIKSRLSVVEEEVHPNIVWSYMIFQMVHERIPAVLCVDLARG
jgi:hypothetical protein